MAVVVRTPYRPKFHYEEPDPTHYHRRNPKSTATQEEAPEIASTGRECGLAESAPSKPLSPAQLWRLFICWLSIGNEGMEAGSYTNLGVFRNGKENGNG